MRIADQWQDFEILDTSSGEKLERWGDTLLIRPDPQVIWKPERGPDGRVKSGRQSDARGVRACKNRKPPTHGYG